MLEIFSQIFMGGIKNLLEHTLATYTKGYRRERARSFPMEYTKCMFICVVTFLHLKQTATLFSCCILIVLKSVVYRKTKQYPDALILLTAGGNESSGAVECYAMRFFHWNKTCPLEISDEEKT